jgi:NADPH2:quinone reductase
LSVGEQPDLQPGDGEVLIDVAAAGVNFLDVLMVQGKYQVKPAFPFSPGSEVSGLVRAAGNNVTDFSPGQRVMAFCGHGGFAAQVSVDAKMVFHIPDTMPFVDAASFIVAYATSHHALKDRAGLRAGETLLVLGAAGGVGLAAVEIGKLIGARVIAAASSDEKLALCRRQGADTVINYRSEDLRQLAKELTGGKGWDVVYDPVGGEFTEAAVRGLAFLGRLLVVGFAAGVIPKLPLNLLLLKSASALGVAWGVFAAKNPVQNAANVRELLGWYTQGKLRPHVTETYPVERYAEALASITTRSVQGKVVLILEPGI